MFNSVASMFTKATTHKGNRDAISRDRILRCARHWTPPLEVARDRFRDQDIRARQQRDEAISDAEKAIERAIQKQRFNQDLDGEAR